MKQWYSLHASENRVEALELANDLLANEDGAVVKTDGRSIYLYTKLTWDALRDDFAGIAIVGQSLNQGGTNIGMHSGKKVELEL